MKKQTLQSTNITTLLKKLPVFQQLNDSQRLMMQLTSICNAWFAGNFSLNTTNSTFTCYPASVSDDTLLIYCEDSATASKINHLKTNLLNYLRSEYLVQFKKSLKVSNIKTQIKFQKSSRLDSSDNLESSLESSNNTQLQHQKAVAELSKPSTIKAITDCANQTNNTQLSNSLKRLAKTLK